MIWPRRLVTAALLTLVAGCGATEQEAAEASGDAVIGGRETLDEPAIGYLAHGFQVEGRWLVVIPFCTGTLIAPDVVLTAAHCVEEARASGYALHFGTGLPSNPRVLIPAKEAVKHPAHGGRNYAFDIAYVVLSKPVKNVVPASVARARHAGGCNYLATGYGTTKDGHVFGEPVSDAESAFRKELSVCADERYVDSQSLVTNATIRTWSSRGSTCVGDSGGPLRVAGTRDVVGVLSNLGPVTASGPRCTAGVSSYYAPVAFSLAFIDEGLAKSSAR